MPWFCSGKSLNAIGTYIARLNSGDNRFSSRFVPNRYFNNHHASNGAKKRLGK